MTERPAIATERIPTGIIGLDEMLHGGFLPQSANLVEGAPGCGKSTLGMHFIYHGALQGEPGMILTFEEFPQQYYRDAAAFGWDFRALERQGLLRIVMSSPEVIKADLERVGGTLERQIAEMGTRRILVDSISHFERVSDTPVTLRSHIYAFLNGLRREGLTSLLTRETPYLLGEEITANSDADSSFIADSYLLLRYVEIESAVRRALIVLKMRGSDHDHRIRQFDIGPQGLYVAQPFSGREGLLSGTSRRMSESFIKAFVKR